MSLNPYQSPADVGPEKSPFAVPGALQPGMLNQVRIVSILMIIQGVLCVLMGGMMLIGMLVIVPALKQDMQRQAAQPGPQPVSPEQLQTILFATYGTMAAAGILPGSLLIFAGARSYGFRNWTLGIVSLIGGLASVGTCYCLPTAIGLAIYGLIVFYNSSVRKGFELAAQGWTPHQIISSAYQQIPLGGPLKPQ